jgi:hypothetical protein
MWFPPKEVVRRGRPGSHRGVPEGSRRGRSPSRVTQGCPPWGYPGGSPRVVPNVSPGGSPRWVPQGGTKNVVTQRGRRGGLHKCNPQVCVSKYSQREVPHVSSAGPPRWLPRGVPQGGPLRCSPWGSPRGVPWGLPGGSTWRVPQEGYQKRVAQGETPKGSVKGGPNWGPLKGVRTRIVTEVWSPNWNSLGDPPSQPQRLVPQGARQRGSP